MRPQHPTHPPPPAAPCDGLSSTFVARHYLTRLPVRLICRQGVITSLDPLPETTPANDWIAPGLVDLQVNGYAGVDFQADHVSFEDLRIAVRGLRRAGCTRFLPTLVTDDWARMLDRLKRLRELRAQFAELALAIAGWHLEGPFLSDQPGYHGAHDPQHMLDPKPERIRELRAAAGDDLLLLTLAPEREGALQAIALAVDLGIRISLGHTNASAEVIAKAVRAGATGFTHFANACPQTLDRHDNIVWRVLESTGLTVSIIPDGRHVSPALFRLAHRVLPSQAVMYVTDAMAAAGAPPGRYGLGNTQFEVGPDQIVRLPGQPYFAGSALRPVDGVCRASAMTGESWQRAWRRFSERPAEWLGRAGGLQIGQRADFCLLPCGEPGPPDGLRVFVGGAKAERDAG